MLYSPYQFWKGNGQKINEGGERENYEVYIPTRNDWDECRVDLNDEAVCYTDGSGISATGQTGAGVYNQTNQKEYFYPLGC